MKEYGKDIKVLTLKAESVRGTYETMTSANAYCVQNLDAPSFSHNIVETGCSNGSLTPPDDSILVGDTEVTLSFDIYFPVTAIDATTYEENFSFIWKSLGFGVVATTNFIATPNDNSVGSVSIAYNIDGIEYRVRGCVASEFSISAVTKEAILMKISYIGTLSDRLEAEAVVATSAIVADGGQVTGGLTLTIDSYSCKTSSLILTCTNAVKAITDLTPTKGVSYHAIMDRDVMLALDCSRFYAGAVQSDDEVWALFKDETKINIIASAGVNEVISFDGKISDWQPKIEDGEHRFDLTATATGATPLIVTVFDAP